MRDDRSRAPILRVVRILRPVEHLQPFLTMRLQPFRWCSPAFHFRDVTHNLSDKCATRGCRRLSAQGAGVAAAAAMVRRSRLISTVVFEACGIRRLRTSSASLKRKLLRASLAAKWNIFSCGALSHYGCGRSYVARHIKFLLWRSALCGAEDAGPARKMHETATDAT